MGILQLLFYSNDKFQFSQKLEKLGVRLNVGAEMYIGEYTDIKRADKDFMPFYMGTSILGGGFSGRLMQTVRDNDGLTYGISASHTGHIYSGGHWVVNASFNPSLFQKGLDATMFQIEK